MPSRLTVLTGALVVLLPALALLQYRWVGQLSDAERERMQRNLRHAAGQFRESFDGEIGRAFVSLQVDSALARDQAWERYAERYAAWANTASSPRLIASVYLVDAPENTLRLRRWNAAERRFDMTSWDGPLGASRAHFEAELAAFNATDRRRPGAGPFRADESLLVAPLLNVQLVPHIRHELQGPLVTAFGFTVLQLDMPFVREQLLPSLSRRHFSDPDGGDYRVAIVDAADPRKVIYRSSAAAATDPSTADVSEQIFGAHAEGMMFLARRADGQIGERNVVVSVFRDRREEAVRTRIFEGPVGRWRLLVQHERGSLEAAVTGVRQRNLAISFGILLLMGVSVGLLAISSRRAQRLAQQQMEFVAGVSHELRTPVAVIRSAAENLSHGVVGDPDRVRRYGDALQAEARRLGEMIERVLQFAGIESGRGIALAPVALEPVIEEAIHAAGPQGTDGLVVERHVAGGLPPVVGDAAAIRSAIQNLVANAIKYGGADEWVGVRAEAAPDRREVRVTVEDHGRGIAASDLPHIFEPFYRGEDATARRIQGSGLGLALVRRIAEAHGGRVTVSTRAGAGTAFTLHLPAAASTPEAVPFRSANEAAAG